ncbi:MAG: D-alanyl-D-alanine carboxypeptidase [Pseudomonadota bacterium]|nr:D-alanyl-D-alanine carboxypeptidase [Pseudomonadota bacterium]
MSTFGEEPRSIDPIFLKHGLEKKTSAILFDFTSNRIVSSHNANLRLPLASVTKAVTAIYGLETIGPDYKFETNLYKDGVIREGKLIGDLYLLGGGDPSLSTKKLYNFVEKLKGMGLEEIKGNFFYSPGIVPEFVSIDPDQLPEVSYNPGFSGLNLNENKVFFKWRNAGSSYNVSLISNGQKPNFSPENIEISSVNTGTAIYRYFANSSTKEESWIVLQKALGKSGSRSLPVRFSAAYTANAFKSLCSQESILVPKPQEAMEYPYKGSLIARLESKALIEIVKEMLSRSTNVTAEVIGLFAGKTWGSESESLSDSGSLMSEWFDYVSGTKGAVMKNHSGLSADSRVSTSQFLQFLNRDSTKKILPKLLKKHRLYGSQKYELSNSEISVVAKTGTMHFNRCLAGYIMVQGEAKASFAIFCADIDKRKLIKPHGLANPPGAKAWLKRSRVQENHLLSSWAKMYL